MKKKRIVKRIVAAALATVLCTVGIVGFVNREKVMALFDVDKAVGIISGLTDEQAAEFYASYVKASLDMVNGEVVLTADRKANVLTNIYKSKEKLTVLEIVPYELASVYNVLIPSEEQRRLVEAYGDEIFAEFGNPTSSELNEWGGLNWGGATNYRLLTSGSGAEVSYSGKFHQGSQNQIASMFQPIELERIGEEGSYSYSVYMPNYYVWKLLKGYEKTRLFDYFANKDNVEVKVVVPGQVTAAELQKMLLGTDDCGAAQPDPVDFIYVGGYAIANSGTSGNIYRNIFFDTEIPADSAERSAMVKFAKDGTGADNFHTDVYRADGTEYKVSELVSEKVWYNSYSKDASGNLVPNDLDWSEVEVLMNYIFGNYNKNYLYVDDSGHKEQQRISCEFQVSTLSNGIFMTDANGCDNNIGKLYYLLCKTSDQSSDREGCTLSHDMGYTSIHTSDDIKTTHTPYFDITTYYWDDNYFLKKNGFDTVNTVTNSNGVQTATYNGNPYWGFNIVDRQGLYTGWTENWFFLGDDYTEEIKRIKDGSVFPLTTTMEYELFYIHMVFNSRFAVYNGVLGVGPDATGNLLDFGLSHAWGEGGWRNEISHQRLDLAVGENFMDQFNIVNYLLGVDETDFIVKPDASFTSVELVYADGTVVKEVEHGADSNAFYTYIYDDDYRYDADENVIYPGTVKIGYKAEDESAKMVSGVLTAYYLDGTPIKTLATYSEADLLDLEVLEAAYDVTGADSEVYQAFKDGNIYFTFTIQNKAVIKKVEKTFTDTAYLYFKHRELFELD